MPHAPLCLPIQSYSRGNIEEKCSRSKSSSDTTNLSDGSVSSSELNTIVVFERSTSAQTQPERRKESSISTFRRLFSLPACTGAQGQDNESRRRDEGLLVARQIMEMTKARSTPPIIRKAPKSDDLINPADCIPADLFHDMLEAAKEAKSRGQHSRVVLADGCKKLIRFGDSEIFEV